MQGSPPPELPVGTGVDATAEDADGGNVLVGRGVFVNVAVGVIGVAVGMAAWVSAIIVKATTAAVLCSSIGLTVGTGVACASHALMVNVIMSTRVSLEKHFMFISPY